MQSQSFSGVSIHIHTHTSSCRWESDHDTHTYIHLYPPLVIRVHKRTHIWDAPLQHFQDASITHTHTHTSSCLLEIWLMMTRTYTYPYLCDHIFFFTFTGAFPLHACGVTRNWCTYFASLRRGFLVETVVLQTVL